jgi:Icc-related predicted phosphoesterase
VIRLAAVGDLHLGKDSRGTLRWDGIEISADVLLIAGDLTRHGSIAEAEVAADELSSCPIPVMCVLGNHEYHHNHQETIAALLVDVGVVALEGTTRTLNIRGEQLGIAGAKGFGGGFAGRCGSAFGEPQMKDFVNATIVAAEKLRAGLRGLRSDYRVALLHYAPIAETLGEEPREIYPFLGSYLLGQAIDDAGADLAVHGHAHRGHQTGWTPGGTPVRNVAQPVIDAPYTVYRLERPRPAAHTG